MSANISSLVGYGLSSDSDSDREGDEGNIKEMTVDGVRDGRRTGGSEERKGRNLLLESGSGSSESDSEPEQEDQATPAAGSAPRIVAKTPTVPPDPRSLAHKLPPPPLGAPGQSAGGLPSGSSVFANPFRARAEERLNALRKHVPLTLEPRPSQIGGRKMCISYRRDGRCRFGISCKFAHDSDLQTFPPAAEGRGPSADQETASHGAPDRHHNAPFLSRPCPDRDPDPEVGAGRKRRVGLSNTLIPPKRALKQYATQRERDRVTPS
ncbi:hypothetical protein SKAU_G00393210 [Synaphobranchus kaupii]|uniref:C3H1-type domain-containing protein n=1 Tax=Synaphobranchus kaupii TaxID=118154 RepID=A0A9Q1EBW0_SYNKA|nr:hypothetical protein SKAU_G00393210 [Synaphobranchus kaupii]